MDGPGIRTTVFLKGCPLNCKWCHNPESQLIKNQLAYNVDACVNCLKCVNVCPLGCHKVKDGEHFFDNTSCVGCAKCLSITCTALTIYGKDISTDEILDEVLKDKDYYDASGGGLTLSGGEPLLQADFCLELLQKAKQKGLNTCIETCGFTPQTVLEKTLGLVDLYLFDYKETNPLLHSDFTGKDNYLILKNLKFLDDNGKKITLRCPIIPTFNDRQEHFKGIGELANSLNNLTEVVIEPYNVLGVQKYAKLGRGYQLNVQPPTEDEVLGYVKSVQKYTNKKVIKL